jgi:RimJ/RimL family protein N-acetyltransferase
MKTGLLVGKKVRLAQLDPEQIARAFHRWGRDSEYSRLLDNEVARRFSISATQKWIEKDQETVVTGNPYDSFFFQLRSLVDDRHVGFVGLGGFNWAMGDAWVGIAIGERTDWGEGFGTDAMRLIVRYGFGELNLRRITLGVFSYNPRAIRSYEKAGFVVEGRWRKAVQRDGQRHDEIIMGILREEWQAQAA